MFIFVNILVLFRALVLPNSHWVICFTWFILFHCNYFLREYKYLKISPNFGPLVFQIYSLIKTCLYCPCFHDLIWPWSEMPTVILINKMYWYRLLICLGFFYGSCSFTLKFFLCFFDNCGSFWLIGHFWSVKLLSM